MGWKAIQYASVDLRQKRTFEIFVTHTETVEINGDDVLKIFGRDRYLGPIQALCPQSIAEHVEESGTDTLYRIRWKGKIDLKKGGRTFNLFSVEVWEGKPPGWVSGEEEPPPVPRRPRPQTDPGLEDGVDPPPPDDIPF